ncbi:hypothetical protein DSO57_1029331 [Entomophthora muscae]|uniref:Uncharacterized protein n=1 Tax=Entomophthora muscae TaxID=34485 RepID=A0ACC2T155_9FUNG|nr:hypothetical protein DSO57_1029331 [Entomophthora muscae]
MVGPTLWYFGPSACKIKGTPMGWNPDIMTIYLNHSNLGPKMLITLGAYFNNLIASAIKPQRSKETKDTASGGENPVTTSSITPSWGINAPK